jgi:hypothetical protein
MSETHQRLPVRWGATAEVAGVVSTKWLDSGVGHSAGILPANAAKMAALHRPAN